MNLNAIDEQILRAINRPLTTDVNFLVVAAIFSIYAFLIFILYHYFRKNYTAKFAHLIVVSVLGYLMVTILKYIFTRPRPYTNGANAVITKPYDPYSFPSGHSFVAFLLLNFLPEEWPKWTKYLAVVYIIFVPVASVYIGVHYPSDVIAGSLFGLLFPRLLSENISVKVYKRLHL